MDHHQDHDHQDQDHQDQDHQDHHHDHDHAARCQDVVALGAHAAGWLTLLAAVFVVRRGIDDHVVLVAVTVGGVAVFAALLAWSATRLVDMPIASAWRSTGEVAMAKAAGTARPEPVRLPMSSAVGKSYGRTTIVARVEPTESRLAA